MLSEATLGSVSKNTALIRVHIVMGETISIENVHILDYPEHLENCKNVLPPLFSSPSLPKTVFMAMRNKVEEKTKKDGLYDQLNSWFAFK
jgi:hypothetical protein